METCPVCLGAIEPGHTGDHGERVYVNCPACGHFGITRTAQSRLEQTAERWPAARAVLSHVIRTTVDTTPKCVGADTPLFDRALVERILAARRLPSIREQADNLVRLVGDTLRNVDPAGTAKFQCISAAAVIGAAGSGAVFALARALHDQRILVGLTHAQFLDVGLSFGGWDLYEQLQRSRSEGGIAFMAMPFGHAALDAFYQSCFRPAVAECGFDLRRIDHKPPAGLIDNRLRVEIRRSRFLIVDLTQENRGAYWEAGFAEGLGKPVIYTCEHSYFTDKGTHFDTNHHHTIVWRPDDASGAAANLKDTIRATLPGEAKMSDD
jgi:predicted RNA-binding Zn-ribbon protein involved in translation (DUF1610 family)